jgi:hypothetical protein
MRYSHIAMAAGIAVVGLGLVIAQESSPQIPAEAVKIKPIDIVRQYSRDSEGWHALHNWNDGNERFYTGWRQFTAEGVRYLIVVTQSNNGTTQTVVEVK